MKNSFKSQLYFDSTCSIRIKFRNNTNEAKCGPLMKDMLNTSNIDGEDIKVEMVEGEDEMEEINSESSTQGRLKIFSFEIYSFLFIQNKVRLQRTQNPTCPFSSKTILSKR